MLHFRKVLGIIFCISFLVSSCSKENSDIISEENSSEILNKELMASASIKEKLAYKQFHLTNLMEKVLEVNPNFNQLEELKANKDDQPRFYIESLLKVSGLDSKSDDETSTSLGAFTDLEGDTWYPVLRIIEDEGNPVDGIFLINSYDESSEKEITKAYKLNNGELEIFADEFTDEIYDGLYSSGKASPSLMTLELALCPIDENFQKISVSCDGGGTGGGGTGGGGAPTTYKLKTINIKDKKESKWDRADIHHTKVFWNFVEPNVFYDNKNYNPSGFEIRKVRNSQLNENLSVDEILASRSATGVLQHVIFEHDNWPAIIQSSVIAGPNGSTFKINWRSWNRDYNHQLMNVNENQPGVPNISNFSKSNNVISYEIR